MDEAKIVEAGKYYKKFGFKLHGHVHVVNGSLRERWILRKEYKTDCKHFSELSGLSLVVLRKKWRGMMEALRCQQLCARFFVEKYLDGDGPYRESIDSWMALIGDDGCAKYRSRKKTKLSCPWDGWTVEKVEEGKAVQMNLWEVMYEKVKNLDIEKLAWEEFSGMLELNPKSEVEGEYFETLRSLIHKAERLRLEDRLAKVEESGGRGKRL